MADDVVQLLSGLEPQRVGGLVRVKDHLDELETCGSGGNSE